MSFLLQPWHLMFFVFAGWANREQQEVIEYLRTENQVLKEKFGKKRILLNDDQRRRLGAKGKILGRKLLEEFGTLFSPDTILRWHRQLVARKWDYSDRKEKKVGRPRIRQVIVDLTVRFANENPTGGYDRILAAFKYHVYCLWFKTLRRRSQRHRITGERMNRLAAKWLPPVRNYHPYPEQRLHVTTCGRSLVR